MAVHPGTCLVLALEKSLLFSATSVLAAHLLQQFLLTHPHPFFTLDDHVCANGDVPKCDLIRGNILKKLNNLCRIFRSNTVCKIIMPLVCINCLTLLLNSMILKACEQ